MIHSYEFPYHPEAPYWTEIIITLSNASAAYEAASFAGYLTKESVQAYVDALEMAAAHVKGLAVASFNEPDAPADTTETPDEIPVIPVYEHSIQPPSDDPHEEDLTSSSVNHDESSHDSTPAVENSVDNSEEPHDETVDKEKPIRRRSNK